MKERGGGGQMGFFKKVLFTLISLLTLCIGNVNKLPQKRGGLSDPSNHPNYTYHDAFLVLFCDKIGDYDVHRSLLLGLDLTVDRSSNSG